MIRNHSVRIFAPVAFAALASVSLPAAAQVDFSGMWGDPPPSAEDAFCHIGCSVEARDHLTELLDDPANDDKSFSELNNRARGYQFMQVLPKHLTESAREGFPRPPGEDRSLTHCEPWGFARQVLAPHALEIRQYEDRITLLYAEWTAERTIWLDGREVPAGAGHTLYGVSTGHFEGDTLVVETTNILADISTFAIAFSDEFTTVERFTRSADGQRLDLEVTYTDPQTLKTPLVMARAWTWAPDEKIYPYDSCIPYEE